MSEKVIIEAMRTVGGLSLAVTGGEVFIEYETSSPTLWDPVLIALVVVYIAALIAIYFLVKMSGGKPESANVTKSIAPGSPDGTQPNPPESPDGPEPAKG